MTKRDRFGREPYVLSPETAPARATDPAPRRSAFLERGLASAWPDARPPSDLKIETKNPRRVLPARVNQTRLDDVICQCFDMSNIPRSTTPCRNLPEERRVHSFSQRNVHAMSHTVLVVDDDPGVLDVIVGMLEDLGCEVTSAESGPDALDQLGQNENISILITDINMPGMDGHELAELAKLLRPGLKILQLSGREPRRGGLPMIRKPFSF
ncbi:response regulator [Bradyrhizobium sp. LA2.1]|uniref:response regulator n=1 Tax=Bradyrhizobium sp. LA2.1 TaxID=3156376 RepID=UPI0033979F9C